MLITRSTVRHHNFTTIVDQLSLRYPRLPEIIDGAVWEIERNPESSGVYIGDIDCWQARLEPPPLLLMYTIRRRIIFMLTILPSDHQCN
jgi:hypothetical protein